jgi:Alcohol dehydrogenase transcription factor Myb/SANT-like.
MDAYLSLLESKPTDPNMHIINKSFFSPTFLTGFIKKYQSLSCLWNIKCPDYSNNAARQTGWEDLTDFCRTLFPNADVLWVKKKVQNMRGSIRKELKKINANKKSGDVYKPRLWYFDMLSFIRDVEANNVDSDSQEYADDEDLPPNIGCIQTLHDTFPDTSFELLKNERNKRRVRNWELYYC